MTLSELATRLAAAFSDDEVKHRVGSTSKKKVDGKYPAGTRAQMLAYIDARAVMDRLDAVVGPEDWEDHYLLIDPATLAVQCSLTVCGVTKCDIGYPNDARDGAEKEPLKAAYSDAFKRAAVKFGIGRFLYDLESEWVEIDEWGKPISQQQRRSAPLRPQREAPTRPAPKNIERQTIDKRYAQLCEHARNLGLDPKPLQDEFSDQKAEQWYDALAEKVQQLTAEREPASA